MVFNGNADEQDIVSTVADSTGVNKLADIKRITRAVNEANRKIWAWIFDSYGGWQYDDSNQTTLPSATTALVSGQQKYTIPTDAVAIHQVSFKDTSGTWHDIDPISNEDIPEESEYLKTPGNPRRYRLLSNVIVLYPAPNFSQAASLRTQFDRGSVSFISTDTTKTPGFMSEFHGAVPVGASLVIARDRSLDNVKNLERAWLQYEADIKSYYKARFAELNPSKPKTMHYDPLTIMH